MVGHLPDGRGVFHVQRQIKKEAEASFFKGLNRYFLSKLSL